MRRERAAASVAGAQKRMMDVAQGQVCFLPSGTDENKGGPLNTMLRLVHAILKALSWE